MSSSPRLAGPRAGGAVRATSAGRPRTLKKSRAAILFVAALGSVLPAAAQNAPPAANRKLVAPGPRVNPIEGAEINDAQRKAVERGLAWLASRQGPSGSFSGTAEGDSAQPAAITALATLAFMQGGNLPGRGKYGSNVRKGVDYLLSVTSGSGLVSGPQSSVVMYGHGFSTLCLAEVYGMTGDDSVKEKLQRAVRLIVNAQNSEGGWRYDPVPPPQADISVTICQIMALRAARDAGITVDKSVIDHALAYVRSCQNPDGGFSYMATPRSASAFPRSAAGVASLFYAGTYEGDDVQRGLNFLKQYVAGKINSPEGDSHYFYGNYYCVQAMFLAGGDNWGSFYPHVRDQLIERQDASGFWQGDFNQEYATSMSLLILQMPNRYLPVFIGKGPGG